MRTVARVDPWWAALTVWGVVNAVNVLQAAGFALVAFVRSGAGGSIGSARPCSSPSWHSCSRSSTSGRLWPVTVVTTALLLAAMITAISAGVG